MLSLLGSQTKTKLLFLSPKAAAAQLMLAEEPLRSSAAEEDPSRLPPTRAKNNITVQCSEFVFHNVLLASMGWAHDSKLMECNN